ncbi:MAG TPA: amidohydrolase, partial [Anaerovoracaceae bacterium]|nr:amidohydrolase [Anaerovoracaceae bacterium]
ENIALTLWLRVGASGPKRKEEMKKMKADIVIKSGALFDSIAERPYRGFVAVKGNRIVSVGDQRNAGEYIGAGTKVLDYGDRLMMPGFHDSHTHLLMAGMFRTYVNLFHARSEEEAALMVKKAAGESPDQDGWVMGFSWYHVFWDNRTMPTKRSLDRYFPDRPVFLVDAEAHGAWVNSKALELAGITDDTPDPFGGEIVRDENGEATGVLLESATGLAGKYALTFTPEQEKALIRSYQQGAAEYGITSVNDVQPYFHGDMGSLEVYSDMDKKGELTVRIHAAPDLLGDLEQVAEWREKYRSDKLRVELLKQFLDGVSTTHTALVLEEYTDAPGNYGISLFDTEAIKNAVPEAHCRGFSVKLHSCGDKSARMALDYFENAVRMYGKNRCRHTIEHVEMLSDEDLPRFGELGIIPSVQPEHVAMTQIFDENPYPVTLGKERAGKTWPFKSLYDTAGILAIGSDCPVVDNNPFPAIYRAVTRLHNDGKPEGGWNPVQKLSMYEILRSYTYGSAYGVSRENELGSLEAGKFADIIVINKNLFEVDPSEIMSCHVDMTMMDGNIIYER